MGWYDGHWGWGWGGWLLMVLAMLAFWGILLAAIVVIVKVWRADTAPRPSRDTAVHEPVDALRLLDERFARGEIDADEYTRRRDLLRGR